MNVVFCSSEVFPFVKTGGLGDVSGSLPWALAKLGCRVKVFMPLYKNIKPEKNYDGFGVTSKDGVDVFFIKNDDYFAREYIYTTPQGDYEDNLERFSFFCKRVLETVKEINFIPDIVHSNDWQTSLLNVYLRIIYKDSRFFKNTKSVLTLHNLAYQGLFDKEKFPVLGIPGDYFDMRYLEFYGKINLLKGGIIFSDQVSAVSPNYARQIQTPEQGCGLDKILAAKKNDLTGILNGINYEVWNPQIDKFIYKNYSPAALEDKCVNKVKLQKELGLPVNKDVLLMGMVSRLTEQKGIDILCESLEHILDRRQLVILGEGEDKYEQMLKGKTGGYRDKFSLQIAFDEGLAHKIYAASDIFLVPSRFEPCGLSQMISYKYAAVPLAHHTGGLADTVKDFSSGGAGVIFKKYRSCDFVSALSRAEKLFAQKEKWRVTQNKGVEHNFSWDNSALEYMNVYKKASKSRCLN